MEAPLISVIVPAYNAKKYLPACVASVQRQEHQNWELLLIDDGSTDGSGALCDELAAADGRVKPHHQQNAGVSAARNAGIERVRGEYVMFLDADDELMPGCMTSLLDALRQTGADIAAGKSSQATPGFGGISVSMRTASSSSACCASSPALWGWIR